MTTACPGLGFDPTPGAEHLVGAAATALRESSAALDQISRVLHGADAGEQWRGQAATAFRDAMQEDLRPRVDEAALAFSTALGALSGWQEFMVSAQDRTRRMEAEASELVARIQARDAQAAWGETVHLDGLEHALSEVRLRARRHGEDYEYQAQVVAQQLERAMDLAPNKPGFWSRLGDKFGDALGAMGKAADDLAEAVGEGLSDLVDNLAPILQTIGDIAAILSAVCGMLAFVPGLQFLGPVAIALAGTAFLAHYGAAAKAAGSPLEPFKNRATAIQLGLDAAGLVAGVGAWKAGDAVVKAAQAAGNPIRQMPQLVGLRSVPLPQGYFQLAKGGYSMGAREFALRVDSFVLNTTGNVLTGIGVPGVAGTARGWTRGEWGIVPGTTGEHRR